MLKINIFHELGNRFDTFKRGIAYQLDKRIVSFIYNTLSHFNNVCQLCCKPATFKTSLWIEIHMGFHKHAHEKTTSRMSMKRQHL